MHHPQTEFEDDRRTEEETLINKQHYTATFTKSDTST